MLSDHVSQCFLVILSALNLNLDLKSADILHTKLTREEMCTPFQNTLFLSIFIVFSVPVCRWFIYGYCRCTLVVDKSN